MYKTIEHILDVKAKKNISGIYAIYCFANDKVYIGKTKNKISERLYAHKRLLNKSKHFSTHLQNAWNKYGAEKFAFIALKNSNVELEDLEHKYILAVNKKRLFNLVLSREYNGVFSKNCEKIPHKIITEIKTMMLSGVKNYKICEKFKLCKDTIKRIRYERTYKEVEPSLQNLGPRNLSKDLIKNIRSELIKGTLMKDVCKNYGVTAQIVRSIRDNKGVFKNYSFEDNFSPKYIKHLTKENKVQIKQLLKDGHKVKEIAKMFGVVRNVITRVKNLLLEEEKILTNWKDVGKEDLIKEVIKQFNEKIPIRHIAKNLVVDRNFIGRILHLSGLKPNSKRYSSKFQKGFSNLQENL